MRIRGVALVLMSVGVACNSGGGGAAPKDGGNGNDAPQDSGGGSDRPVITNVPAAWSRPADCHGVGELCEGLGCGTGGMCQLDGNICTPRLADINNIPVFSVETPYCLAYSCMTYEQASCFCTGPAAAMFPVCKSGPAAVAGLCVGEASSCNSGSCCPGLDCVTIGPTSKVCYDRCAGNADCDTGCCTDRRDTGDQLCAPLTSCQTACIKRAQACTRNEQCCNGTCITDPNPDWNGCRPACQTSADCDTACCVAGVCVATGYCGCDAGCAAGSSCTTFDGRNFACRKDCTMDTDCPSVCCSGTIPNSTHGVCITAECTCPGGCTTGQTCLTFDTGTTYACYQNCMRAADCSTNCCSQPITGKNYGSCLPAARCGL